MMEAMSAGIPVVAFDIAGVAEAVRNGENGVLVPFEEVQMLADKTAALIEDPGRMKEIGDNGRKRVLADFSNGKMCEDTERYLQELVAGP
jgi:glycosyltransferase involved in cell wall biosynthesis